ncbi:MAG: (d)CMP kinase [Patescibacteria group bacterium]|nr:(d)CMP kinase [Patescibacteria group bacterium]
MKQQNVTTQRDVMKQPDVKSFQIAIDGPVAAGKGTVSRLVADKLGFLYIDTGATYRMAALVGLRNKIDLSNEDKLASLVKKSEMSMRNPTKNEQDGRLSTILLDQEDVSWKIRTEEVSQASSQVAVHPKIRVALVKKQQKIAQNDNVIMEGRDITYRVLPSADLKIYLTANQIVRTKRRHFELLTKGVDVKFDDIFEDLVERDERDKNRKTDPLKKMPEAWVIDTSDLSIEKVVELIVAKVKRMMKDKKS